MSTLAKAPTLIPLLFVALLGQPSASAQDDSPEGHDPARGESAVRFVNVGDAIEGDGPSDLQYTPDGSTLVIPHRDSRNLVLRDAETLDLIGVVPVSGAAQSVAITPDGTTAVVALLDMGVVSFVDLATQSEVQVIPVGSCPARVKVSPAGDVAAVALAGDSELVVLNLATGEVDRRIEGVEIDHLAGFSNLPRYVLEYSDFTFLDNDRVINLDPNGNRVQFVNIRTGDIHVPFLEHRGAWLSVSRDRSRATVLDTSDRKLTVIDLASETVSHVLDLPFSLSATYNPVGLNADGTRAAIAALNSEQNGFVTYVVDLDSGATSSPIDTVSSSSFLTTFDGQHALSLFPSGALVDLNANDVAAIVDHGEFGLSGAVSPVAQWVAIASFPTYEFLRVVNTDPAGPLAGPISVTGPGPEGDSPLEVAVTHDGELGLTLDLASRSMSLIDAETGSLLEILSLGSYPISVTISPDDSVAVATNLSDPLSIVDLKSLSSTDIAIGASTLHAEFSPDGQFAYVLVGSPEFSVRRLDLSTNTFVGDPLPVSTVGLFNRSYTEWSRLGVSPDGKWIVVAATRSSFATVIDAQSWEVAATVTVGSEPNWVTFSPDSQVCYVTSGASNRVKLIDLSGPTPAPSLPISVGRKPWQTVYTGNGRLLVNNWQDMEIGVIDLASAQQIATIPLPWYAEDLTMVTGQRYAYAVTGQRSLVPCAPSGDFLTQSGQMHVIDVETLSIVDTIQLDSLPIAMDIDQAGRRGVIAAPLSDGVFLVDLPAPCARIDLAVPFGVLDFSDVSAFLSAFGAMSPAADLAAPEGVFDFSDVFAFLVAFGAGCP